MNNSEPALLSTDLHVDYPQKPGVLRGVRVDVFPGEIVGLVGESGSGKSTLALAVMGLLDHTGARIRGAVRLLDRDLTGYRERQMREVRGRLVSLIPQSPAAALNPALRIGSQLREAWRAHSRLPWSSNADRVRRLFDSAGLPGDQAFLHRLPGEISVGQAQRVLIVMALLHGPPLLIADEPTSALDMVTQRDVLELLVRICAENRSSMLFISHDLPAVAAVCDRLAILHDGCIVEDGPVKEVLAAPKHSYTKRLIAAVPRWD